RSSAAFLRIALPLLQSPPRLRTVQKELPGLHRLQPLEPVQEQFFPSPARPGARLPPQSFPRYEPRAPKLPTRGSLSPWNLAPQPSEPALSKLSPEATRLPPPQA